MRYCYCDSTAPTSATVIQGLRPIRLDEENVDPGDRTLGLKNPDLNSVNGAELSTVERPIVTHREESMARKTYPHPSHQAEVKDIISTLSLSNMQSYLANLTVFHNRYWLSQSGADAADWLLSAVLDIISNNPNIGATARDFVNTWVQSSVIARIPGETDGPVTIIGTHLDSINKADPMNGRAPGADDGGSACVNLLEAFRALLASRFKPKTPVEFHWYSAEEPGSYGSQAIAEAYRFAGIEVKAMVQLPMTAYVKPGTREVIAMMPDYTNPDLNTFLGLVIDYYSALPHIYSNPCGPTCSDHDSWTLMGYPACMALEGRLDEADPFRHSELDTITVDGFSWLHTFEFTKIAVGFAYELGM